MKPYTYLFWTTQSAVRFGWSTTIWTGPVRKACFRCVNREELNKWSDSSPSFTVSLRMFTYGHLKSLETVLMLHFDPDDHTACSIQFAAFFSYSIYRFKWLFMVLHSNGNADPGWLCDHMQQHMDTLTASTDLECLISTSYLQTGPLMAFCERSGLFFPSGPWTATDEQRSTCW